MADILRLPGQIKLLTAFSPMIERINRIQQENKMKISHMSLKLGILAAVAIGAALIGTFHSVVMANPEGHYDQKQMSPEKIHTHIKARLDELAARLEIKASQQAAWEDFEKSVEMLADRNVKKPNDNADASSIARYRADKATAFANDMARIADATARLQVALTEDQQKILNQSAHRFLDRNRKMNCHNEGHGWDHGNAGGENHHNGS
jgi:hypothetical protein